MAEVIEWGPQTWVATRTCWKCDSKLRFDHEDLLYTPRTGTTNERFSLKCPACESNIMAPEPVDIPFLVRKTIRENYEAETKTDED